ncbi:MAG TPA: tryptophan 2,3-dioxygenase family protein [Oculatellaceae cyanobacterium]|jgi:tryptophan 2,3-dioxygenase
MLNLNKNIETALNELEKRYGNRLAENLESNVYRRELTYDDYLKIETLLSLQQPLTDYHDELIFLVYHQQTELWFKLVIHELERAIKALKASTPDISSSIDAVTRINRYFAIITNSFSVLLEGLSTEEFLIFRKAFGSASGFQSLQFRIIEILAGLQRDVTEKQNQENAKYTETDQPQPQYQDKTEAKFYWECASRNLATNESTLTLLRFKEKHLPYLNFLYSQRESLSLRLNFYQVVSQRMNRKIEIVKLLETLFDEKIEKDLIVLAEELLKMDEAIIKWKQAHLKTVAKHLSQVRRGTGETNWGEYLTKSIAEHRCFLELQLARQNVAAKKCF